MSDLARVTVLLLITTSIAVVFDRNFPRLLTASLRLLRRIGSFVRLDQLCTYIEDVFSQLGVIVEIRRSALDDFRALLMPIAPPVRRSILAWLAAFSSTFACLQAEPNVFALSASAMCWALYFAKCVTEFDRCASGHGACENSATSHQSNGKDDSGDDCLFVAK